MSQSNEFKCDNCLRKVKANYNGEHYLPPSGWIQLYDPNEARCKDLHLCEICFKPVLHRKTKPKVNK